MEIISENLILLLLSHLCDLGLLEHFQSLQAHLLELLYRVWVFLIIEFASENGEKRVHLLDLGFIGNVGSFFAHQLQLIHGILDHLLELISIVLKVLTLNDASQGVQEV